MYEQNLLDRRTAERNLRLNVEQIDRLPDRHGDAGRRVRNTIMARHEATWARFGAGTVQADDVQQA
jgi:hypothetical protein